MITQIKESRLLMLVVIGVLLSGLTSLFYLSQHEPRYRPIRGKVVISTEDPLQERHEEAFALRDGLEAFGGYLEKAGANASSVLFTNFISHMDSRDAADLIEKLHAQSDEGNATARQKLIQALLLVDFPIKLHGARESPSAAFAEAREIALKATSGAKPIGLLARGKAIAPQFCGSCHVFPPPDIYSRSVWARDVFPVMELNLGLRKWTIPIDEGWKEVFAEHVLPESTPISTYDWTAIKYYYLKQAPTMLPPIKGRDPIKPETPLFNATIAEVPIKPFVIMVKIDPKQKALYVGDTDSRKLYRLNPDGEIMEELDLGLEGVDAPVHFVPTSRGALVTTIGYMMNSDRKKGTLLRLNQRGLEGAKTKLILKDLRRPTDLAIADLNGDGRDDLVICEHGYYLGRFCWWENTGTGYVPHELLRQAGSLNARVADFDRDGHLDIALITSQSREGLHLFINDGGGKFTHQRVVEYHPAWGNSHLEVVDFDSDGDLDLLTTNGDNGDIEPPPLRPYHGIHLYLNDGHNHFEEAFFWPQNGAFGALPEDFDDDGDMDILAISYFPDYSKSIGESLVYLENLGGLKFKASTFSDVNIAGRWLVMDKGDLDGDGDTDVVLGAFNEFPGQNPHFVNNAKRKSKAAIVILKNNTR